MNKPLISDGTDVYRYLGVESGGSRILVVDSEVHLRVMTTEVLTWFGYEVHSVEDDLTAWDSLQVNKYDLLIANYNLGGTTGVELVSRIHGACITLPAILTSAKITLGEFKQSAWPPVKAIVGRPYTAVELLTTVKRVLSDLSPAAACLPSFR